MNKITKSITWFLLLFCSISYGQITHYEYKRELQGVAEQWHKLVLPNSVFTQVSDNLSDLRIFGITATNDTVEAPYIINDKNEKIVSKKVSFNKINTASNGKGHFVTFEIPTTETFNQIELQFHQQNFDWKLKVEGSQNQQEWFTLAENYRILSINNQSTNYQFTTVNIPSAKYRYIRFFIESKEKPELRFAGINNQQITEGTYRDYPIKNFVTTENKTSKQTEIEVELDLPVPVNQLFIEVADTVDYYRTVSIEYLADSFNTENGWKYTYGRLSSGTLNSLEKNWFKFERTKVQKFKLIINNQDNKPLTIKSIQAKGYETELVIRFTEKANYFLTYGNKSISKPNYELSRFSNKIPAELTSIQLGEEFSIEKEIAPKTSPLFENKNWLWAILILMVILMGWFSIKMLSKK